MPARPLRWLSAAIAVALLLPHPPAEAAPRRQSTQARTAPLQDKAARLNLLYEEYWDASLQLNPLQATFQGDPRHGAYLPNFLSAAYRQQVHEFTSDWLARVEAIGEDGLGGQDLLSYRIFVRQARNALDGERFPGWMQPVTPYNSPATLVAMLGSGTSAQPFETVQDYERWSQRVIGVPALFDQAIANMREGITAGVVLPRPLAEKLLPQLDAVIRPAAEHTVFWAPVRNMPESFAPADRERLTAEYRRMIENRLMPSYRRLRGFIATEYLPAARTSAGLGALPGGAQWYAWQIRQATTTDAAPAQLHQTGLDEVARIHDEIAALMKQTRFRGNRAKFFRFMQEDKRFRYADEGAVLAKYAQLQATVQSRMGGQFMHFPRAGFEIRPVEAWRAAAAPAAAYTPPVGDGPGVLQVNTSAPATRRSWEAEDLFLHEGLAGHHLQLALQQELGGLPRFRRLGAETAFTEGWGLYAESLGSELGLYQDPYARFGYLHSALLRAVRLVVDTGLHDQGWSREQAIDYIQKNSAASQADAVAEVERSMALPGQPLAYKVGELKIAELRERARNARGPGFDVRAFHAEVLKDGSVPLDVLEDKIDAWIASPPATP